MQRSGTLIALHQQRLRQARRRNWRSRDRCWLLAVEELVDAAVGPDVEVAVLVELEGRPV